MRPQGSAVLRKPCREVRTVENPDSTPRSSWTRLCDQSSAESVEDHPDSASAELPKIRLLEVDPSTVPQLHEAMELGLRP